MAGRKFSVAASQRLAAPVHIVKKQGGLAGNFHLRMISRLIQLFRSRYERIAQGRRFVQSAPVNACGQPMETPIEWVQKNNSASREKPRHQFSECGSVGVVSGVRFAKCVRDFLSERSF